MPSFLPDRVMRHRLPARRWPCGTDQLSGVEHAAQANCQASTLRHRLRARRLCCGTGYVPGAVHTAQVICQARELCGTRYLSGARSSQRRVSTRRGPCDGMRQLGYAGVRPGGWLARDCAAPETGELSIGLQLRPRPSPASLDTTRCVRDCCRTYGGWWASGTWRAIGWRKLWYLHGHSYFLPVIRITQWCICMPLIPFLWCT